MTEPDAAKVYELLRFMEEEDAIEYLRRMFKLARHEGINEGIEQCQRVVNRCFEKVLP